MVELIGPPELALFCVKLYDTETAARRLPPLLAPHTAVRDDRGDPTGPTPSAAAGTRRRLTWDRLLK